MIAVKVLQTACGGCGKCDEILAGFRDEVRTRGNLLVSPYNRDADYDKISKMIQACDNGAIHVEDILC